MRLFSLVLLLLSAWACSPDGAANGYVDIRSYYFPLDSLDEGLVYEYRYEGTGQSEYWYYKRVLDLDDAPFLVSTQYGADGQQLALTRMAIMPKGLQPRSYMVLQLDSASGKVVQRHLQVDSSLYNYPFRLFPSDTIFYPARVVGSFWPDTNLLIDMKRYRYFGAWKSYQYQGEERKALLLKAWTHRELEDSIAGGHWRIDSIAEEELWVEGLGLAERSIDQRKHGGTKSTMRLSKIYTMDAFLEKFRPLLSEEEEEAKGED